MTALFFLLLRRMTACAVHDGPFFSNFSHDRAYTSLLCNIVTMLFSNEARSLQHGQMNSIFLKVNNNRATCMPRSMQQPQLVYLDA